MRIICVLRIESKSNRSTSVHLIRTVRVNEVISKPSGSNRKRHARSRNISSDPAVIPSPLALMLPLTGQLAGMTFVALSQHLARYSQGDGSSIARCRVSWRAAGFQFVVVGRILDEGPSHAKDKEPGADVGHLISRAAGDEAAVLVNLIPDTANRLAVDHAGERGVIVNDEAGRGTVAALRPGTSMMSLVGPKLVCRIVQHAAIGAGTNNDCQRRLQASVPQALPSSSRHACASASAKG
jgi:hypothetical protein